MKHSHTATQPHSHTANNKKLSPLLFILLCSFMNPIQAQTNPTVQGLPFTQNFGTTTFTAMPTGCVAWTVNSSPIGSQTNAQNSTPNGNAGISAATTVQSTGGCYGYATGSNGRFYVQTSSNTTNGTSQLACAVNTGGWSNINIAFDVEMISANPRTIGVVLQYRIGTTGAWLNVTGGVYSHNSSDRITGATDNFTNLTLPQAAENNAVVQLRWAIWRGSETGNSSGIAIDNISVTATSSQTAGYFRSKQNGNWNDVNTWEASADNSTWSNATASPDYTANTITIQNGNTVTLTATDTIDQVVVNGKLMYADFTGSTPRINNGAGCDLIINGTFEDLSSISIAWASGAIWSMGANGTIIRTRSTSANNWRDKYDEGIAAIPATATWILRKTGTDNPTLSSTGNMVYPNLIIENNTGTTWATASSPGFSGTSSAPVIKGNLDIGGNGTGNISFINENTFTSPVLVIGDLTINAGSTLRSYGTGFAAQANLTVNGTIDYGTSNSVLVFSGNNNQNITGTGSISFLNVQLNKTNTTASLTLQSPVTVTGAFNFTNGYLVTSATNLLTYTSTSSVSNANNNSFIEGPVKKTGNSAFVFPVGKSNNYQPVSISAPANSNAAYTAEYFNTGQTLGTAKDSTIDSVSTCEYWTLNNVGTAYPVSVTLGWNSQSCLVYLGAGNMTLTEWNGSQWIDLGNSSNTSGRVISYLSLEVFGTFTLGKSPTSQGITFSTFLCADGTVQACGTNSYGQLGDNSLTDHFLPAPVYNPTNSGSLTDIIAISNGGNHSLALSSNGTVLAWGYNAVGQLGDGTTTNRLLPIQIPGISGAIAVAGSVLNTYILKNDGTVWATGRCGDGELGNGVTGPSTCYVTNVVQSGLGILNGIIAISAGGSGCLALKSDGTVWAWGPNSQGELGDATTNVRPTPFQVPGLSNIVAIAKGMFHSLALDNNGNVYACGLNNGCFGNNTSTSSFTFTPSSTVPPGIVAIAAGQDHSHAIRNDGTLFSWGLNFAGQLGDGTTTYRPYAVQTHLPACINTNAGGIIAGLTHSTALLTDGTTYAWGENNYGQLGDGTNINSSFPVFIHTCLHSTMQITGITNICNGSTTTLTATPFSSGTFSYNWSPSTGITSGANTASPSFSPGATTTYSVAATNSTGCISTSTVTITVNPLPIVSATASPVGILPGGNSSLVATASVGTGFTYSWSPSATLDNASISNPTATPVVTTTYTVTVTNSNGCTSTATVIVYVTNDAKCNIALDYDLPAGSSTMSAFVGLTSLTGKNIRINGHSTFTINNNFTFDACNIIMEDRASMEVSTGVTLTLTNKTHIYSCNEMWDALYVYGTLITNNDVFIEDCIKGVKAEVGVAYIDRTIFNRNWQSIEISSHAGSSSSPVTITKSVFTSREIPASATVAGNPTAADVWTDATSTTPSYVFSNLRVPFSNIWAKYGVSAKDENILTLGSDASTGDANGFDNIASPIWLRSCNTTIYNNKFQNVNEMDCTAPGCGDPVIGAAIYASNIQGTNTITIGGIDPYQTNNFYNTYEGININGYQSTTISNNTINNSHTGPSAPNFGNAGITVAPLTDHTIDVEWNNINNCETGIWINRSGIISNSMSFMVNNNSVSANGIGHCSKGVFVSDVLPYFNGGTNIGQVETNNITNANNGIWLSNVKQPFGSVSVSDNVCDGHVPTNKSCSGITATGCIGVSINLNHTKYLNAPSPKPFESGGKIDAYGIYLQNSNNMNVSCNQIDDAGRSLVFEGSCASSMAGTSGVGIYQNMMIQAQDGFVLLNSCIIGQQGMPSIPGPSVVSDNVWDLTSTTGGAGFIHQTVTENSSDPTLSMLYVTNTTSGLATMPTINFQIASPPYSISTLIASTGNPIACGQVGSLLYSANSLAITTYANELQTIVEDTTELPVYSDAQHWQRNQFVFSEVKNDSTLISNIPLNSFYTTNTSSPIGLLADVADKIKQGDYSLANSINNSLISTNILEQNQQTINGLILQKLMFPFVDSIYIYPANDSAVAFSIAMQCPLAGGNAVYQARNLSMSIAKKVIDFEGDCKEQGKRYTSVTPQSTSVTNFKLYPNPNDGNMIFEYSLPEQSFGMLILYDITGKAINKYRLEAGENKLLKISEDELYNGIYFYSILIDNKTREYHKFVIIK